MFGLKTQFRETIYQRDILFERLREIFLSRPKLVPFRSIEFACEFLSFGRPSLQLLAIVSRRFAVSSGFAIDRDLKFILDRERSQRA